MRELAGNRQRRFSLAQVAADPLPANTTSYIPRPQRRANRGRYAVTPLEALADPGDLLEPIEVGAKLVQVFHSSVKRMPIAERKTSHQLTTEEFIAVRVATVRESTRHCFWPTEVLEKFLAAEVITQREQ